MAELVGLIPAAGRGVRAYPHTATVPKSMLEVDGVPNLQRNVELLRDQLGIRDIRIVVGYHGDVIRQHFGDEPFHGPDPLPPRPRTRPARLAGSGRFVDLTEPFLSSRFVRRATPIQAVRPLPVHDCRRPAGAGPT